MHAVVVSFDCLPVAWIGCYGNMSVQTPRLDALAADSVVFDACYAADVTPGRDAAPALIDRLREAGVACFTQCDEAWRASRRNGASTLAWLQWPGAKAGDFEDAEQAAAARTGFAGQVNELDAGFGRWLEERQDVLGDDTLLVVTARAGAVLFSHPNLSRGCPAIVDPIVHVPLIMHAGRNEQSGTRRRGLVSAVDLEATLVQWFGLDGNREAVRSLLPILRGEVEGVRDSVQFSCEGVGRGVRTERFSCLYPGMELPAAGAGWDFSGPDRPWLFAKPEDVWDILDVAAQNPDEVDRLVRSMGLSP